MIKIENLIKEYNLVEVVNIPSLTFEFGESIGLVGNNGAGKTTLFSMLLDLIAPSKGTIYSKDTSVASSEEWKSYTASFLDETFLIDYLTAEEYFEFVGRVRGVSVEQIKSQVSEYSSFFNGEVLGQKKYIRDFSKGNQKKIGIVGCFIGNPELVVLDEPFANLDPTTQIRLKELIRRKMEDRKMTIIVSSHDLQHTFDISDRVILMEKGKVVKDVNKASGSFDELMEYFNQ
ncbi:ABC transporter ATP-binding protein [Myroides pelagicus]|uniref:ATP-binding cassette domain-containing protein n=1 Tax=Myroides pelagicus TaxID=270914 RepID=A0A7K1GK04_9FLAO|nr:ABC transporter ATP-binding protein [Myroides pelagicus]MEC4113653.1 ABC transporter ATP-binding protein [Myroides pelagicus]MTH28849.1 ATP-binding cassette domain-containing protein [Myroides pelagicus]